MDHKLILVISDIHLGSPYCNVEALLILLARIPYTLLIIVVGDLFERDEKERLDPRVIEYLLRNREKIVYIEGNHDPSEEEWVGRILGIPVVAEYRWRAGNRNFLAIHGHQFDHWRFIFNDSMVDWIFSLVMNFVKHFHVKGVVNVKKCIEFLRHKFSMRSKEKLGRYAKKSDARVVIYGHTHESEHEELNGAIEFVNCGHFLGEDEECTFVTIKDGNVALRYVSEIC